MEARSTTEVRIYNLILNHVSDRCEGATIVAISGDYEALVRWYEAQKAPEKWRDGRYLKTFAEGSPLEWYNPPCSLELNNIDHWGHGISDEWIRESVWYRLRDSSEFLIIGEGHV